MLFHVAITVRTPRDGSRRVKRLGALEHERAAELQRRGKWLHLWRVVGQWANISIFRVESPRVARDPRVAASVSFHGDKGDGALPASRLSEHRRMTPLSNS